MCGSRRTSAHATTPRLTEVRPRFHFTADTGWINDPHGITWRDGGYDVFFQYVPGSTSWQPNCHWGHARGRDLFSLRELPVAIAPDADDDGIWTGSLVRDDAGRAHAFYTATNTPDFGIGRVRSATPGDPQWLKWRKGPVVVTAPDDLDLIAYRDPFVRREGDGWRMFVGAADREGTAMALTYVSDCELSSWRYDGVALARSTRETEPVWTGALWECPQVFPIGDRWAMVSSVWDADTLHYAAYALGDYAEGRFVATSWGRLTYGPSYYAPSLFLDDQQRPCLSFWMRGIADLDAGWASAHSIPHLLQVRGDRLVATPHPDLERYHSNASTVLDDAQAVDLAWQPTPGDQLAINRGSQTIATLTCEHSDVSITVDESVWTVPRGNNLRLIIDGPVLELATDEANFGVAIAAGADTLSIDATGTQPVMRVLA